jgi:AcrR family transcriptional regulator
MRRLSVSDSTARSRPRSQARPREEHAPARLRAATRQAFIEAGTAAFARHGLSGASISQIARDAGVANGTFYLHFGDKRELYAAIVEGVLEQLAGLMEQSTATSLERGEAERREIEAIASFIEANEVVFQMMAATADTEADHPVTRMFVARRMRALEEGQRLGTVRRDIRIDIAAHVDIGMMISAFRWWLGVGRGTPRDELIETLTTLRLFGTVPPSESQEQRST